MAFFGYFVLMALFQDDPGALIIHGVPMIVDFLCGAILIYFAWLVQKFYNSIGVDDSETPQQGFVQLPERRSVTSTSTRTNPTSTSNAPRSSTRISNVNLSSMSIAPITIGSSNSGNRSNRHASSTNIQANTRKSPKVNNNNVHDANSIQVELAEEGEGACPICLLHRYSFIVLSRNQIL